MSEPKTKPEKSVAAALLESMRAVQQALMRPPGLSPQQLATRLQEWQRLVTELAGGVVQGTELATLYEIIGVLNSSLNLTETLGLVMDSLIHLTEAERGCLMLLDEENNLEIRAAQHFDQGSVDASDLELSHTVVREAVERGEPVVEVEDLSGDPKPDFAGLTLHRGEVLGIAGLMGAGRTELLRILFGLAPVRSGRIRMGIYSGPASPMKRWPSVRDPRSATNRAPGAICRECATTSLTGVIGSPCSSAPSPTTSSSSRTLIRPLPRRDRAGPSRCGRRRAGPCRRCCGLSYISREC